MPYVDTAPSVDLPCFNFRVTSDLKAIQDIKCKPECTTNLCTEDIKKALVNLNTGKAADNSGLTAEHLKNAGDTILVPLKGIFGNLISSGEIPGTIKEGRKLPIPKKGKDTSERNNYRGITITSTIGKAFESTIQQVEDIPKKQNPFQFGFSKGRAPSMATLNVTETMAEAIFCKKALFMAALDGKKAFDVVSHPILLRKLHVTGTSRDITNAIQELYSDAQEVVLWDSRYSKQYTVAQGVRQGGVLSANLYKLYIDNLLNRVTRKGIGTNIGTVPVGITACADDIILLADSEMALQELVDEAYDYAVQHRYELHPTKSVAMVYNSDQQPNIMIGDNIMPVTNVLEHLGIQRNMKEKHLIDSCIDDRISLGRRTVYSLTKVGLHGENGVNPTASVDIIEKFIIPRVIYGLDAMNLSQKHYEKLDSFLKKLLKDIQALPKRTSSEAVYLISGCLPIKAELDCRQLGLWAQVSVLDSNHPLKQIIERQITNNNQDSWTWKSINLAMEYSLDAISQLQNPTANWKRLMRDTIRQTWLAKLLKQACSKSSLTYLHKSSINTCRDPFKAHPVWTYCGYAPYMVQAASHRVKMLVGVYMLQDRVARFGISNTATCQMCEETSEDMAHFLLECPSLRVPRQQWLPQISALLQKLGIPLPKNNEDWCRTILNGFPCTFNSSISQSAIPKHTSPGQYPTPPSFGPFPVPPACQCTRTPSKCSCGNWNCLPKPALSSSSFSSSGSGDSGAKWKKCNRCSVLHKLGYLSTKLCHSLHTVRTDLLTTITGKPGASTDHGQTGGSY